MSTLEGTEREALMRRAEAARGRVGSIDARLIWTREAARTIVDTGRLASDLVTVREPWS